jgi:hypothetical protein
MPSFSPTQNGGVSLDYDLTVDLKYYHKAIKGIDNVLNYDILPGKLKAFLDQVRNRSKQFGWNAVLTVPTIVIAPALAINQKILDNYGTVTMDKFQAHARTYLTLNIITCTGQDAVMLYNFLFESLTSDGFNKVNIYYKQ